MKLFAAPVLALVLPCLPAQAGVTTYNIGLICKMDIEQYCKSVPKNRIRDLRECLAKHDKDLFPNCQDHYKEAR